jgi:pimeloyl-ACP methyl ester carboxylesterase
MSAPRTWQSWIWFFVKRFIFIYLALILLLALLQRHLIYIPGKAREEELLRQAERDGMYPWRDRENRLIGWRSSPPGESLLPQNRLLVFHGNAGYALHRSYYAKGFQSVQGGTEKWELYLFEYPGYGARPGSPSEQRILAAARRAFKDLYQDDRRPLYLLGESLGSSFAARLAAENPRTVSGLFLVTPLTCLADVASNHYRFLPVRLMLRERHDVQVYLEAFPGPVAFLVAGRDEVMSGKIGEKLYAQYGRRKKLWIQSAAGHNTLDFSPGAGWWQEVDDFLTQPTGAIPPQKDAGSKRPTAG